jgi:DNA-binding SARP family transcriptional activator
MMQTLDLELLGSPRFVGKTLPLSKLTALAAYLVLQNKWVARDELLNLFYPNSSEPDARNSLRQLVLRLKSDWQNLEIESKSSKMRLALPCDVHEFKMALAQKNLARVLDFEATLLEGLYLADAPEFMAWLEFERSDIRAAWVQMALAFARTAEPSAACTALKKVLQLDELCEEAVQIFLERSEPNQAKLVFEQFKKSASQMGLEPHPKTQALYDQLSDFSQTTTRHNLPFSSTPFVGREQQLRSLHEIIEHPMSRLITVVGLGGMGKTRLALQAAHGWLESGFDGVYLVTLADVQDISGLPNAIASAMNIPVYTDVKTELLSLLKQKRVLLLLDNFEHFILEPHGFLHDLLEHCAKIKVLVTSRTPLEIYGEWLFDLQGFEAQDSAGTQLFWQTAQRHNPKLEITDQSSALQIVQRLGGMPLAIELAAYWTRLLTPKEVLHELEQGLKLETKSMAVPMRQRAIDLMLEQSYDRLGLSEKIVLQGMCVFRGGATLAAARAVTSSSLEDLQRLVETGLLQKNNLGRFDLHELLRQYVLTRVKKTDLTAFQQRQGQYFSELVLGAIKGIEKNHLPTVAVLSLEYPNIEVILSFFTRFDLQDQFIQIADIYLVFLRVRGLFWTVLDLIDANLNNPDLSDNVRQQNQVIMACVLQRTFQLEASAKCFEQTLPSLKPTDTTWGYAWLGYSETLLRLGQVQQALTACQNAIAAFENTNLHFYFIRAKILLAYAFLYTEQFENAKTQALETIQIANRNNVSYFYGDWYWEVGKIFIALQEPDTLKYVQGTFEFYKGINDMYSIQFIAREAKTLYLSHGQTKNHDWVQNFLLQLGVG